LHNWFYDVNLNFFFLPLLDDDLKKNFGCGLATSTSASGPCCGCCDASGCDFEMYTT
jgi:hypothetical protein